MAEAGGVVWVGSRPNLGPECGQNFGVWGAGSKGGEVDLPVSDFQRCGVQRIRPGRTPGFRARAKGLVNGLAQESVNLVGQDPWFRESVRCPVEGGEELLAAGVGEMLVQGRDKQGNVLAFTGNDPSGGRCHHRGCLAEEAVQMDVQVMSAVIGVDKFMKEIKPAQRVVWT